jgi:hypothetical protein
VWQPIAELPTQHVFAFGRPWNHLAESTGLRCEKALGLDGTCYGSNVPSRAVRVYILPGGQQLIVEWHAGSAGPPNAAETALLRKALM